MQRLTVLSFVMRTHACTIKEGGALGKSHTMIKYKEVGNMVILPAKYLCQALYTPPSRVSPQSN